MGNQSYFDFFLMARNDVSTTVTTGAVAKLDGFQLIVSYKIIRLKIKMFETSR
ncbi:hypothetical protein HanIR_Chr01g0038491 [Helianthus annuus]|nr:hypothetical protein HanIR_Chr01g0038491 [Helianthus annuus]